MEPPPENETLGHKLCSVCHDDFDFYAYGECNHPTCTKCILKLRKFGSADVPDLSKCPTCRRHIKQIVIMDHFVPFDEIELAELKHDPEHEFLFPNQMIQNHYRGLLKSVCPVCGEEKKSLSALNRHTTFEHQLSYCDLCIRYARLLPCEFVPMQPTELVLHRKWDKDRKKGHPLCSFCEERFYEFEDLVRHIRDCHFLCDICLAAGNFVVFREQRELLQHYEDSHHLCTDCRAQQRISCFTTADQLGLHRFQEHPNEVARDPNSWLPVSVQLVPSAMGGIRRTRDAAQSGTGRTDAPLDSTNSELFAEPDGRGGVRFVRPNPATWTGDDFPALGASTNTASGPRSSQPLSFAPNVTSDQGSRSSSEAATVAQPSAPSITLASVTSRGRGKPLTADDFPSLPGCSGTVPDRTPLWTPKTNPHTHKTEHLSDRSSHFVMRLSSCATSASPSSMQEQCNTPVVRTQAACVPQPSEFPSLPAPSVLNPQPVPLPSLVSKGKRPKHPEHISRTPHEPSVVNGIASATKGKPRAKQRSVNTLVDTSNVDRSGEAQERVYNHIQEANILPQSPRDHPAHGHALSIPSSDDFPSISRSDTGACKLDKMQLPNRKSTKQMGSPIIQKNRTRKSDHHGGWPPPPCSLVDPECILFAEATYLPVLDMESRNRELIRTVENALSQLSGKSAFSQFADLSRRYSHKEITATAYMEGLLGLLTSRGACDEVSVIAPTWIASMLALLPNIGLQRALLRVIQGQGAPRLPQDLQPNGGSTRPKREPVLCCPSWAKDVVRLVQCCQTCGQVCLRTDMLQHQSSHPKT